MKYSENLLGKVLATLMHKSNDAGVKTVAEYLCALLEGVWEEGEGFNGKRPFGNSGWEWDLYKPLAEAGLIKGKYTYDSEDDYKDWYEMDTAAGDKLIAAAIRYALLGEHS